MDRRGESGTIITTEANTMMGDLHDRMPVILSQEDYDLWLDLDLQDASAVRHLLAPCPDDELVANAVSTYVNSPKHDDPECITGQRELF